MKDFDELIDELARVEEINNVFNVKTLEYAEIIAKKDRTKCVNFYTKYLPPLLADDFALYTTKDMYEDKVFKYLIQFRKELELDLEFHKSNIKEYIKFNLKKSIKLYTLLILYLCSGYMKLGTFESKSLDEFNEKLKLKLGGNLNLNYFWYRGVTNIRNYDLMPSMYRLIKDKYLHIDDQTINALYSYNNLKREYYKIFNQSKTDEFYAYMQHAIAYSPLLDFTRNINIAGSFAVSPTNPIDYKNTIAGIYLLISDKNGNTDSKKINIEIFNEKLSLTSVLFKKPLHYCKISDFYVKYRIITNKSNDRMKYQNGLFMYLIKAVFVKKKLLFINSASTLFFLEIPYSSPFLSKISIYNDIKLKHEEFSYEHLMDPYSWFGKPH